MKTLADVLGETDRELIHLFNYNFITTCYSKSSLNFVDRFCGSKRNNG